MIIFDTLRDVENCCAELHYISEIHEILLVRFREVGNSFQKSSDFSRFAGCPVQSSRARGACFELHVCLRRANSGANETSRSDISGGELSKCGEEKSTP